MKIICSQQELLNGVNIVSKAVSDNTTMALLKCILIQAGNGEIRLTANDMDLGIETVISGQIEIAGMAAIDAKDFLAVIRKLDNSDITIETDDNFNMTITCNKRKINLLGKSGDEFTFLPKVEKKDNVQISMFAIKDIIRQTIFSIGNSDINKVMSGVHMVIKNDQLRVTTLDGHRISIRKVQLKSIYEEQEVIIPGKALNELSKILPADADKEISIYFSDAHVSFEFDKTIVVSRLIDGQYINVDKMMSSDYKTKVKVNKAEIIKSVDLSMLFSKEGNKKPLVVDIRDDVMELKCNAPLGSLDDFIEIQKQGDDILIGFNPKFVMDALRAIDEDEIDMYFINPRSPLYIKDENEKYVYMILPINLS
ncbi:MAG: DNA polymerase III subunit beta [Lachnospiraceae bacterium]|nr:DNA polymerase III subunit beta [Lachnospiraceae bacterium]